MKSAVIRPVFAAGLLIGCCVLSIPGMGQEHGPPLVPRPVGPGRMPQSIPISSTGAMAADRMPESFRGAPPLGFATPQVPHLVIRGPQQRRPSDSVERQGVSLRSYHEGTIDGAVVQPTWRQPYAYGYLGAQKNGHLRRHSGFRGGFAQWTWK